MEKDVNLIDIQKELREGFRKMDKGFENVRSDFIAHDTKFEKLTEELNKKPDREEFPQLLDKIFEKKVIREKLGVEN